MSYEENITVKQNDYGYDIQGQITDADGKVVPLTGATLKLIVAEPGQSPVYSGAAEVLNATQGEWKWTVPEGTFTEANKTYEVEVELVYASKTVTADGAKIFVKGELKES